MTRERSVLGQRLRTLLTEILVRRAMGNPNPALLKDFKDAFREAASVVYKTRSISQSVTQNDLIEAMVEASFLTLDHAIRTKLLLSGRIRQASIEKLPSELLADQRKVAMEILSLLESSLSKLDTKHEYSVGMVMRERRPQ